MTAVDDRIVPVQDPDQVQARRAVTGVAGEHTLTLATGETRQVRFTMRRLARVEDRFGSIEELAQQVVRKPVAVSGALLSIGLGGIVSEDQALDLLDGLKVGDVARDLFHAVGRAYGLPMGDDAGVQDGPGEAVGAA